MERISGGGFLVWLGLCGVKKGELHYFRLARGLWLALERC